MKNLAKVTLQGFSSVILETFLREVGVEVSDLPLQKSEVVSGVTAIR